MVEAAKLITAFAALLGALAWPACFLIALFLLRKPLEAASARLPRMLDRVSKVKIGMIDAELEKVAESSAAQGEDKGGTITPDQIKSAARIEIAAETVGPGVLVGQMDQLCLEYDSLRRTLQAGPQRTQAMTRVLVQMRALAPSLVSHIEAYKTSQSPGSRLAAIAMMQMNPASADVAWLVKRFEEDQPFVFYHAALALQNAANGGDAVRRATALQGAAQALARLRSFDGPPDSNSVAILEDLVEKAR